MASLSSVISLGGIRISLSPMSSHLTESGICEMKFSKICALTGCSDPMDAASI
jgi:hypothetical protein